MQNGLAGFSIIFRNETVKKKLAHAPTGNFDLDIDSEIWLDNVTCISLYDAMLILWIHSPKQVKRARKENKARVDQMDPLDHPDP